MFFDIWESLLDMTTKKLHRRYQEFISLRSAYHMACLIDVPEHVLQLQSGLPQYSEFRIRKKGGGHREIEDPFPVLKGIQRRLNRFLQAVYFVRKTKAAYGFILAVKNKPKRNIVSNAKRHLHAAYLMNFDIRDFFHSIDKQAVIQIFTGPPFGFSGTLALLLGRLCCYKGRLPMGAPTSPVLTNFFAMGLDRDLDQYADDHGCHFTRYVDDMTISGNDPLGATEIKEVGQIIRNYGLSLNERKTRFYGPGQTKTVTGIVVSDRLELAPDLLEDTRQEIQKLRTVMEVSGRYAGRPSGWVKHYRQRISGYLQFAGQVLGSGDPLLKEMKDEYNQAMHPPNPADPVSWSELPYRF